MQVGGQVKFYSSTRDGVNNDVVVMMRSEEALLTLAEACCRLGYEVEAREAIDRLRILRNPEAERCQLSGDMLMDEIRLQRKLELWGEGFSWFDDKRWNLPIDRRAGDPGDKTSGNWPASMAVKVGPSDYNGWRYVIPQYAVDYNPQINITLMKYKDVEYTAPQTKPAAATALDSRHKPKRTTDKTMLKTPNLKLVAD